ncbi:MAG: hypothetical protein ABJB33_10675 [Gemmatimonadota bacterium]
MFARVSTYMTGPDTVLDPATEEASVKRVMEVPGCRGVYFLTGGEGGKALSITLWDSADAVAESRSAATVIREESSTVQGMKIIDVDEFEVTSSALRN